MIDDLLVTVVIIAALGCGLMAGLFFIFSVCVMRALGELPAATGIAAMQAINRTILNPVFGIVFAGTPVACTIAIVAAVVRWDMPGAGLLLTGGVCYVIGGLLVTLMFNVPRNNTLAAADPAAPESAGVWADYLRTWTAWNHVRTAGCLAAAVLLTLALAGDPGLR